MEKLLQAESIFIMYKKTSNGPLCYFFICWAKLTMHLPDDYQNRETVLRNRETDTALTNAGGVK
jgi:hypothetical protein